jgi:hypothetical protein
VTWDTWDQVYSLAFKHSSVADRGNALKKADDTFVMWYNSWYHDCTWAKEPHGLIVRLSKYDKLYPEFHSFIPTRRTDHSSSGFLHVRHLLYRAFLNLVVQKSRRQESISDDLFNLATTCIQLAVDVTRLTVSSIQAGYSVSGTLQAVFFHALSYLWNASVTLVLYATSPVSVREKLSPSIGPINITDEIRSAIQLFKHHADAIPVAHTAAQKIDGLLHKEADGTARCESNDHGAIHVAAPRPTAMAMEGIAEAMPDLDFSQFDFALDDFDEYPFSLSDFTNFLDDQDKNGGAKPERTDADGKAPYSGTL